MPEELIPLQEKVEESRAALDAVKAAFVKAQAAFTAAKNQLAVDSKAFSDGVTAYYAAAAQV